MSWAIFLPIAGVAALTGASAPKTPEITTSPLVVIDPGHGGRNAGCAGAVDGVHEKQVTLAIARRVAGHLKAAGFSVVLTREADDYLTLRQRTRLANELDADLFLSIHANSSGRGTTRGYESFVLSVRGTQVDTPALRRGEGTPRLGVSRDVAEVLDAVEHGVSIDRAATLAAAMQRQLAGVRGRNHDRGVRQDSHHVLLGATMPAVLVEVGFLDHPVEGRELTRPAVQDRIAAALSRAVVDDFR